MKKLTALFLSLLLVFSVFSFGAAAEESVEEGVLTISDDLETVYLSGESYSPFSVEGVDTYDLDYNEDIYVLLSEEQRKTIKNADAMSNLQNTILLVSVSYRDGTLRERYYLKDSCREIYDDLINNHHQKYLIQLNYLGEQNIQVDVDKLHGKKLTLTDDDLNMHDDYFDVVVGDQATGIFLEKGLLLDLYDTFYFIDFSEVDTNDIDDFYEFEYPEEMTAWEITDEALLQVLRERIDDYYGESYGIYHIDDMTEGLAILFIFFAFMMLPIAAIIFFLIVRHRAKKETYKKLAILTVASAAAVLMVFIALLLIFILI